MLHISLMLVLYLAPFLWHHSSPLGDSCSGSVQAQDAPAHLDPPALRRYSQIGVGSGSHRGSLVAKLVSVDYPPRGGEGDWMIDVAQVRRGGVMVVVFRIGFG